MKLWCFRIYVYLKNVYLNWNKAKYHNQKSIGYEYKRKEFEIREHVYYLITEKTIFWNVRKKNRFIILQKKKFNSQELSFLYYFICTTCVILIINYM